MKEFNKLKTQAFFRKYLHVFSKNFVNFIICALVGLAWYLLLYGRYPLYFTHVNWIYAQGGDVFQHQLGWEWFRQEAWHFPIGRIDSYGYPFGTSVTFMDAIPLMAIPLKVLSPFLDARFQYFGIWELFSIIGQIFASYLILGEFTKSFPNKILGASLLVLSPPLIFRSFLHDSLTAQWILMLGIWINILDYRHKGWRGAWPVLFAVAVLTHLYFVAMLIPLWMISLFFNYIKERSYRKIIFDIIFVVGTIFVVGYCIGIFSLNINDLGYGFGNFSWNLNGFIDPSQYSSILKPMTLGNAAQYEGYSYLGLGNLLMLPFALILFLLEKPSTNQRVFFIPFLIAIVLYTCFALSNKAFVNDHLIWKFSLPDNIKKIASMFQSSGRFIWPVFYFIVIFGLIVTMRSLHPAAPFLIMVLILQFIDIQPLYSSKEFTHFVQFNPSLNNEFWLNAAKTNKHIFVLSVSKKHDPNYEPIALYAVQNHLTLNWGYFARGPYTEIRDLSEQVGNDLITNPGDDQTIYIIWDDEWFESNSNELSGPYDHVLC